jgi:hypothetical protein
MLAGLLVGCAGEGYVETAPPPDEEEIRPASPADNAVWIGGYWQWYGSDYHWHSGYWDAHPRGRWVPGRWEHARHGYHWIAGRWDRHGLSDRERYGHRERPLDKARDRDRDRDRGNY